MPHYDLIGDIHGHAAPLRKLLEKLGYQEQGGCYRHPERKVIFVGDYIDRGPAIPEVLHIVKSMAERGAAIALMGNHEYNAICFHTPHPAGGHLRPHSIKNFKQHAETLLQFQGRQAEYDAYIDWFKTLPLFLENEHFRAVHAAWHSQSLEVLNEFCPERQLTEQGLRHSTNPDHPLHQAIENTLKGLEAPLPPGHSFLDKDGHERSDIRIKWWLDPRGRSVRDMSVIEDLEVGQMPFQATTTEHYGPTEKPVFFGHYWLKGQPELYRHNVCCLDYSIAKGGHLVAYRFDGEQKLRSEKLIAVHSS